MNNELNPHEVYSTNDYEFLMGETNDHPLTNEFNESSASKAASSSSPPPNKKVKTEVVAQPVVRRSKRLQAPVETEQVASPPKEEESVPMPDHLPCPLIVAPPQLQIDAAEAQPASAQPTKSLSSLCSNFLELFKNAPPPTRDNNTGTTVEICQLTEHLGVKRRRIYDIVNVLEAIDLVCRVKKNTYRWNGKEGLSRWFAELQRSGLEEEAAKALDVSSSIGNGGGKVKGMTQTAQRLIQIFLVTGRREIAITDAAEQIMPFTAAEQSDRQKAMKQKCRRLYDIANVLQPIGVIQKKNAGSEARSFRWVYPISPQDMHNYLGTSCVSSSSLFSRAS